MDTKDHILARVSKMLELETKLMKAGPATAETIIVDQQNIQEHYYNDVTYLLDIISELQSAIADTDSKARIK